MRHARDVQDVRTAMVTNSKLEASGEISLTINPGGGKDSLDWFIPSAVWLIFYESDPAS